MEPGAWRKALHHPISKPNPKTSPPPALQLIFLPENSFGPTITGALDTGSVGEAEARHLFTVFFGQYHSQDLFTSRSFFSESLVHSLIFKMLNCRREQPSSYHSSITFEKGTLSLTQPQTCTARYKSLQKKEKPSSAGW